MNTLPPLTHNYEICYPLWNALLELVNHVQMLALDARLFDDKTPN